MTLPKKPRQLSLPINLKIQEGYFYLSKKRSKIYFLQVVHIPSQGLISPQSLLLQRIEFIYFSVKKERILLMCALRAHIKLSVFGNIFSRIEKVMIVFSIFEKMFLKTESLMCTLRAYINRTQKEIILTNRLSYACKTCQLQLSYACTTVWIQFILLKTENRKHCSKIIFKCVKSAMEPI